MKNKSILTSALLIAFAFSLQTVSAQITITLPKFPKIKKPKVEQTKPSETTTTETTTTINTTAETSRNNSTETNTTSQNADDGEKIDIVARVFLEDIEKAQKLVDDYSPDTMIYLVPSHLQEWLWRAVSPHYRNKWKAERKDLLTPVAEKRFDAAFAKLSASAANKLPAYKASLSEYSVRNAAEERLMKGVITNIADYKIFQVGLKQANWLIDKNDYGLPTARYKHGVIYLRNTKSDHPYCWATYVNIKQDYAGGGTYGASYARYIEDEMVGCPAGMK